MNLTDFLPSDCEPAADISEPAMAADQVSVRAGQRLLLDKVSLRLMPGKVTVLTGPNGAGKSTLLSLLAGDRVPDQGEVTFSGKPLAAWPAEVLARRRAVLPQSPELGFHFSVRDVVALGRHPHRGRASGAEHAEAIARAMAAAGVTRFADQDCCHLSGGERHRVHFARVLAQLWAPQSDGAGRVLLLDEPTAGLDLSHQQLILAEAQAMAERGVAVLAVLHDLNLAQRYGDQLVILHQGRIFADGTPQSVLTAENVRTIWHVPCEILCDSQGARHIAMLAGA